MSDSKDSGDTRDLQARNAATPSVAFSQAMTAVERRSEELCACTRDHDFEGVINAARSAVNLWLAGRVALRRLLARTREVTPYGDAARSLLEEKYMALLVFFEHATRTIDVPEMSRALRSLRATLTSAMAHPLASVPTD